MNPSRNGISVWAAAAQTIERPRLRHRMTIAYDTLAPDYARHRDGFRYVVAVLEELLQRSPGQTVLEVGCGTGIYSAAMAEAGADVVYGMDPSRQMLRQAPACEEVVYLQGAATDLPLADHALDMIFSINVVHHIENVCDYFREAFRVLKPGGIFCTATDSEAIIERRVPLSRYWPATVPVELERYHGLETMRGQMAALGFIDIDGCEEGVTFTLSDAAAYRDKAFSCLQLISEEAFREGLRSMESDLRSGPLQCASELAFLWAQRP